MKTNNATIKEVTIDANGKILGRIATQIADLLRGKDEPTFVPNQLVGKRVIVINAEKVKFTGNKMIGKKYAHHSGWPGGFKEFSLKEMMAKDSTLVITSAVSGMLPKNKLRSIWLKNLRVYKGEKND